MDLSFFPVLIYGLIIPYIFNIKQIVPLFILEVIFSILSISVNMYGIIYAVLLSIIYLIYGLKNKYDEYKYYSVIYLIISILAGLYTIVNNYVILIAFVILGTLLIIYAIIKEWKKGENSNEIKK